MEQPVSLLSETLRLLKERQFTLPEIAQATGLSFYWLRKLASNEIADPGVNRIQKLWEHLACKKLNF